jgi:hypothetical protein
MMQKTGMIAYLESLHFSDENRHIILNFRSCNLKDMDFARYTHILPFLFKNGKGFLTEWAASCRH